MLTYRELLNKLQSLSEEQLDESLIIAGDDQYQIGCELIIAEDDLYDYGRYTRKEIEESKHEYINGFPKQLWLDKYKTFDKGSVFIKTHLNNFNTL